MLKTKELQPQKAKRRSLQLADIFVATALITGIFGFWRLQSCEHKPLE